VLPMPGSVAYVTPDSVQAEVTGARFTRPPLLTRFTKRVSFALATWLEVIPEGNQERTSNCSSAVLPEFTYRLESVPKFTVGRLELTKVSPASGTAVALATLVRRESARKTAARRTVERCFQPHPFSGVAATFERGMLRTPK
jgi:hypothetical protein